MSRSLMGIQTVVSKGLVDIHGHSWALCGTLICSLELQRSA